MVTAMDYDGVGDLIRMVGGRLEQVKAWPTGDVLYVDEDGALKPYEGCFFVPGNPLPICSNGVVVGRAIGDSGDRADPTITLFRLMAEIRFCPMDDRRPRG